MVLFFYLWTEPDELLPVLIIPFPVNMRPQPVTAQSLAMASNSLYRYESAVDFLISHLERKGINANGEIIPSVLFRRTLPLTLLKSNFPVLKRKSS